MKNLFFTFSAALLFAGCSKNCLCSIKAETSGQLYTMELSGSKFEPGQNITVQMTSSVYSFGQAKNVSIYSNESLIHDFGAWLYFSENSRSFTLPTTIPPGSCYTLRVTKEGPTVSGSDDELYVSSIFRIK